MNKTNAISCLLVLLAASAVQAAAAADSGAGVQGRPAGDEHAFFVSESANFGTLDSLPREKQGKAMAIVEDSLPTLRSIDCQISLKVEELNAMTFDNEQSPENLPRLGMELQRLREELRSALNMVNLRLQREVGVSMKVPSSGGIATLRGYCQPSRYMGCQEGDGASHAAGTPAAGEGSQEQGGYHPCMRAHGTDEDLR